VRANLPVFWRLTLAIGASALARSTLATVVPLFAVAQGLAPVWVGLLVALPNALPVVLGPPAGRRVDRAGSGRWLLVGAAGMASAPLMLVLVPTVPVLALAQLVLGAFQLAAMVAGQAFVADLARDDAIERDVSTYATVMSAGRLAGPLLAGAAIDVAGFRAGFGASLAALLLTLLGAWSVRREAPPGTDAAPSEADASDAPPDGSPRRYGARDAWRELAVRLAVVASAGVFVGISARQAFLPVLLEAQGFPATTIGAVLSAGALASVSVRPFTPWIARRLGGVAGTLVAATILVSLGVGLLGVAGSLPAFVALSVAVGLGAGVGLPMSAVAIVRRVGHGERATALGLRLASNRGAQLTAPIVAGSVIGAAGFAVGFGLVGLAVAVLALATRRLGRRYARAA
jgi:MFS family permease